jgi:pyruvate kinase
MSHLDSKTKIVATLGPATAARQHIEALADAGVDVFRLNFSHGDHAFHGRLIREIQRISEKKKKSIAILQDLPGPKMRIGRLATDRVFLKKGTHLELTLESGFKGDEKKIPIPYPWVVKNVPIAGVIYLSDGTIKLAVRKKKKNSIICQVMIGGYVSSGKGMNIPGLHLPVMSPTRKDREHLRFGLKQGVDFVAVSFVRSKWDIERLLKMLPNSDKRPRVIAKIEKEEAVAHLDEIIGVSDGIMVARGDLGVETSLEKLPVLQKEIVSRCHRARKPVIVATQMLESMVENPFPTRAEVTDVATAIFDGADAVMLSEETSIGKYPVECVKTMNSVAFEAEKKMQCYHPEHDFTGTQMRNAIGEAACQLASTLSAKAILVLTRSGKTAELISTLRPSVSVMAFTSSPQAYRALALYWGVHPYQIRLVLDYRQRIKEAQRLAFQSKKVKQGDLCVVTAGATGGVHGVANLIQVIRVGMAD